MKKIYKVMSASAFLAMVANPISAYALTKTETVYSSLNVTGEVLKTNVNVQLSDLDKGEVIDYTNLEDIQNINGKEKFRRESTKVAWKSTGKDIFYQGKISSELPISVQAKYYFDGEEVEPKDIKGKSGSIKIEFFFQNHSYDYNNHMYTPFVVSTVSILPSDGNSNISVTNGKVVNTGSRNIITAISSPGLYESTNISEFSSLDTVTIQYDTTKFSMSEVYFVATPKLLEDVDINKLNKVNDLNQSLDTLQNGMNELQNGSYNLADGAGQINDGLSSLNVGLKSALVGSIQIRSGLNQISAGSSSLTSINTLVETLYNKYRENNELLTNITTGATQEKLEAGIRQAMEEKTALENQLSYVNSQISALEEGEKASLLIEEQTAQLAYLRGIKEKLEAGILQYAEGISEAQKNLASLPLAPAKISGANEVISQVLIGIMGVPSMDYITEETIATFEGQINSLVLGIDALEEGSNTLTEGIEQLYSGSNALLDGTSQLSDGSNQLYEGISKINTEGIHKLGEYGDKAVDYSNKVKKLVSLSKEYHGFSSDNVDGTIFIYKLSNTK